MPKHFKGSSKSLLILGEQMMGLKNILKFSKWNTAPLRKTVSKLPHILAQDIFAIARKLQNSIKK